MHMQLTYYLESNTLMATTQYGYRSGQSTELASQYYGISYLQNRIQFVQINSTMSSTTSINIGIPQGSVLGPLFFNICINNIKNCTNKFDIVSYADNTTLISTINSFTSPNTNISDNINSELENVNKWLAAQKLCLNV